MLKFFQVAIAACGACLASFSAVAQQPPPACPPEPMRVVRSRGGVVDYLGTVANVPDLCRIRRGDGTGAFYYGSWRSDWPGAGDAYPVIKNVVLGAPGTRLEFVTRSVPGLQFVDRYTNEGNENMQVGGVTYTTLRVAHERQGIEGNTYHSIITVWRDVRTGVTLRTSENQISGQSYGPDTTWTAIGVGRLPPQ